VAPMEHVDVAFRVRGDGDRLAKGFPRRQLEEVRHRRERDLRHARDRRFRLCERRAGAERHDGARGSQNSCHRTPPLTRGAYPTFTIRYNSPESGMMHLLLRVEQSGISQWIRSTDSIFGYYGILTVHAIGMGIVVGVSTCVNLRILGFAPALPLGPLEQFLPVLWLGFWMNAASGTILLATDATHKLANPDFYVKMIFIALALGCLQLLKARVFRDPHVDEAPASTKARILALASLACWLGAIIAGRLLAYQAAM